MAEGDNSSTNLIVNYLPQTLTDEEFTSMFQSVGPLRASKIIRDRATGYSYGFGFVDYTCESHALKAISTLNGLKLQNKTLKVAYARPGSDNIKNANLYVTKVPRPMNAQQVEELFSPYGTIVQCRVLTDQTTGKNRGTAFVLFDQNSEAEAAIESLNGFVPEGATEALNVAFAEDNRGKARAPALPNMMNRGGSRGGYGPRGGGFGGGMGGGPMRNMGMVPRRRFNPMNGAGSTSPDNSYILYVYNIGADATDDTLWYMFESFGAITQVNCIRDQTMDCCKGYGFVTMPNYHEALNAIQSLNGYDYYGRCLQVSFKTPNA